MMKYAIVPVGTKFGWTLPKELKKIKLNFLSFLAISGLELAKYTL